MLPIAQKSLVCSLLISLVSLAVGGFEGPNTTEAGQQEKFTKEPVVSRWRPKEKGGTAFKLVYAVSVPRDVFWRFKTDFDNEFLVTNKYIKSHRLTARSDRIITTETVYTYRPKVIFRWRTTLFPRNYRLEYRLLNPRACGQKYHFGQIKLEELGQFTGIVHVAHFDFLGAFLWAHYPGPGGMPAFLRYTARWEQETIRNLIKDYSR
jgi:hypothetical protein